MPLRPLACGLALLFGLLAAEGPARADDPSPDLAAALARARAVEQDLVTTVRRVRASSVSVVSRRPRQLVEAEPKRPLPLEGVGSGVVIEWMGTWVLTNYHVVDEARYVEAIGIDGVPRRLRLHASDRKFDLAILSFVVPPAGLTPATLGPAGARLPEEGTWVVATGNPFFLALDGGGAASLGVMSGVREGDASAYVEAPTLQHDAEINPGSSGGPLWTAHGILAGINGTIATRARSQGAGPSHTGASFSIPIRAVRSFLTRTLGALPGTGTPTPLVATRPPPVARTAPLPTLGYLGIRYRTARDRQGRPAGARIMQVAAGSPALGTVSRAGLMAGDLITRVEAGGRMWPVRTARDVLSALASVGPGAVVSLDVLRRGRHYAWSGPLAGR